MELTSEQRDIVKAAREFAEGELGTGQGNLTRRKSLIRLFGKGQRKTAS